MARINQKRLSILNTPKSGNILINTKTQLKTKDSIQNKETYIAINGKDISYDDKTFNYVSINNIDDNLIENLEVTNVYQLEAKKKYIFFPGNSQLVTLLTPANPKIDDFFCVVLNKDTNQHVYDSNIFKIVYVIDSYYIDLTGVISFQRGNAFSTYTFYWDGYRWIRHENVVNNKKNIWNDENILFFDKGINVNQQINSEVTHYASALSSNLIGNNRINIEKSMASPSEMDFLIKDNSITKKIENFIEHKNYLENCIKPFKDYNIKDDLISDFVTGDNEFFFIETNMKKETVIEIELDVPVDSLLEYTSKMQVQDQDDEYTYLFTSWQNSPHYFRNSSLNIYLSKNRTNSPFLLYNFKEKCFESRGWSRKTNNGNEGNPITEIPDLNFYSIPTTYPTITSFESFRDALRDNLKNHNFTLTNTPINDLKMQYYDSLPIDTSFTNGVLVTNLQNNLSLPSMQYGFPYFPCFHLFEENLISMKSYINKNFIIDRVVADLDIQLQSETSADANETDLDISNGLKFSVNYFILNNPNNNKKTRKYLEISPFNFSNIINNDSLELSDEEKKINSTVFSKIYSPNIQNPKLQSLSIFRKLFKSRRQDENNTYDALTTPITSTLTLDDISFNKDIVSFGNIVLFSPNKQTSFTENQSKEYTTNQEQEILRIKNNCDKFIDTFNLYGFNKDDLHNDLIFLDFDNHVTINSYAKKSSHTNLQFSSNNFNYQLDFKSTLGIDSKEITTAGVLLKLEASKFFKRNMLSRNQSGKDMLNQHSVLGKKKNLTKSKSSINLFKNMKDASGVVLLDVFKKEYFKRDVNTYDTNFEVKKSTNFSPYLLTPNDNLAFGFSISPNISPKLFKHNCKIKKGKVIFKLYGYLQKDSEKINDWTNLTTQNQENINTNIAGNTFIENEKYNIGYLDEYTLTTLDRIYSGIPFHQAYAEEKLFKIDDNNKTLIKLGPDVRKNGDGYTTIDTAAELLFASKIFSGRSYIPVLKLNDNIKTTWLYDNDSDNNRRPYTFILNLLKNTSNGRINNFRTEYRGKEVFVGPLNSEEEDANFDTGLIEYTDYNIAAITTIFKKNITDLSSASAQDVLQKYNFPCYFSFKRYGQFSDLWQQRLYSTIVSKTQNTNIMNVAHVVTQQFIDTATGLIIENMKKVSNRNKSSTLELYNSGYKSITDDGIITPWDADDFFALKHVAFFE